MTYKEQIQEKAIELAAKIITSADKCSELCPMLRCDFKLGYTIEEYCEPRIKACLLEKARCEVAKETHHAFKCDETKL